MKVSQPKSLKCTMQSMLKMQGGYTGAFWIRDYWEKKIPEGKKKKSYFSAEHPQRKLRMSFPWVLSVDSTYLSVNKIRMEIAWVPKVSPQLRSFLVSSPKLFPVQNESVMLMLHGQSVVQVAAGAPRIILSLFQVCAASLQCNWYWFSKSRPLRKITIIPKLCGFYLWYHWSESALC